MPAVDTRTDRWSAPIKPTEPLTMIEREEILVGIERGDTMTAAAGRIGRHRCTVSAEVSRNGGHDAYRTLAAQARADAELARSKVPCLVGSPRLAAHVAPRLRAKDSPMTLSVELAWGVYPDVQATISHVMGAERRRAGLDSSSVRLVRS